MQLEQASDTTRGPNMNPSPELSWKEFEKQRGVSTMTTPPALKRTSAPLPPRSEEVEAKSNELRQELRLPGSGGRKARKSPVSRPRPSARALRLSELRDQAKEGRASEELRPNVTRG